MSLNQHAIMNYPFEEAEIEYSACDTMLYALGLGFGRDPMDADHLPFVYEQHPAFKAFPTQAVVVGMTAGWLRDPATGVDYTKVLHGEQSLILHRPFSTSGRVVSRQRVLDIIDKGAGRGALILTERQLRDKENGELIATMTSTSFARANGGFSEDVRPSPAPHPLPERAPDQTTDIPTEPGQALLYRLSGDWNPLHADPAIAKKAGFHVPILHGLCSYGIAAHAVLKTYCDYDVRRFRSHRLRFSAPVMPGETIRIEMWKDDATVSFRALVGDRIVLNNGCSEIAI